MLSAFPGVKLLGANERRAQIEAEESSIAPLRARLGADFAIENVITHERS